MAFWAEIKGSTSIFKGNKAWEVTFPASKRNRLWLTFFFWKSESIGKAEREDNESERRCQNQACTRTRQHQAGLAAGTAQQVPSTLSKLWGSHPSPEKWKSDEPHLGWMDMDREHMDKQPLRTVFTVGVQALGFNTPGVSRRCRVQPFSHDWRTQILVTMARSGLWFCASSEPGLACWNYKNKKT